MPASVFYSVCQFGTGTIETGSGTITITGGVATLSVEQTGNIGAGVEIEYNSLACYIAPNRIAFNSGGTAELLSDTKIEGGTSGATGIVRFVEVTSGTWAGGDAAGWIYFEKTTGTWNSSEQINRTKPTSSSNIATTNGSLEGNIGNGNTEFVVKSAVGADAANQTAVDITSIHHEYASLSAFEAGFTDASHINNTDLTLADVVANACCYYDHVDYTVDANATIDWTGTTDSTRYLVVFVPMGSAESINKQRHSGIWDGNKYNITTTGGDSVVVNESHTVLLGLQIFCNYSSDVAAIESLAAITKLKIDSCVLKEAVSNYVRGVHIANATLDVTVQNCVVEKLTAVMQSGDEGIFISAGTMKVLNCTVNGFDDGIERDGGTIALTNCAVFNNTTDFDGTMTAIYCASDDTKTGTGNIDWDNGSTDWANIFNDYANGDFSLNNFTGTGAIIEQGTDISSSEGIWRDIAGNERGATPDIGAFEYVGAPPVGAIMNQFQKSNIGADLYNGAIIA